MFGVMGIHTALFADVTSAGNVVRAFVMPVFRTLIVVAGLACTLFIIHGAYQYISSSGKPEGLSEAKKTIKNALIGLVIVIAAALLIAILSQAYGNPATVSHAALPSLTTIPPQHPSNGLVDVIIKAVTGFLNNIVQTIADPFLKALAFFTTSTPLMANNATVFNLWLVMVGVTDVLFVLIIALLGFHVMSFSSFGFQEIEIKHLFPRIALVFLAVNSSIFAIDWVIQLSNVLIRAINSVAGTTSVWSVLSSVVKGGGSQSAAALIIMVTFLIFAFILLIYYVGRLVTLYIGAVLSPIVLLLWIVPGFREFSETAAKAYFMTIFVLFVHVVILLIAASLFAGMSVGPTHSVDALMAMIAGAAALLVLLKTQGIMMQFSYAGIGPRTASKLGGQLVTAVSYLAGKKAGASEASSNKENGLYRHGSSNAGKRSRIHQSNTTAVNRSTPKRSESDTAQTSSASTKGARPDQSKIGHTSVAPSRTSVKGNASKKRDKS